MNYRISSNEFVLLTFLHENAEAFDASNCFDMAAIVPGTSMTEKDATKAASYLSSLGLVGLTSPKMGTFANVNQKLIYLTGDGERYMRELEETLTDQLAETPNEPAGTVTTIRVKFAAWLYSTSSTVITKVLTDYLASKL